MPYQYEFRAQDGVLVELDNIDKELCQATKYPYSKTNFCMAFIDARELGMAILMKANTNKVTPELFDQYVEANKPHWLTEDSKVLLKQYLCGKYTFEAKYTR